MDDDLHRRSPAAPRRTSRTRVFGTFTRTLRQFVLNEVIITMPFAVRSMSGLAADFLRLDDRGYLRPDAVADIAVFDRNRIRDRATYDQPRQYAELVLQYRNSRWLPGRHVREWCQSGRQTPWFQQ